MPTVTVRCAVQPPERTALAEKVVGADGFKVGKPASIEVSKRFAVPVSMTFTVDPMGGPLPLGVGLGLPLSVDAIPPLGVEGVVSNGQVPPHAQARTPAHARAPASAFDARARLGWPGTPRTLLRCRLTTQTCSDFRFSTTRHPLPTR
jgi:hypothetical protein